MLAVFLFHARVDWAQGGLGGVSVFFALSGFLITRNLLHEFGRSGTIRLGEFWWRRVRRLLPASIIAVAVSAVVAIASDIPVRAIEVTASVTGWKNWQYLTDFSYSDIFVIWWSLAVEEQYYLVYPLLLLLFLALARRTQRTRSPLVAIALGLLALASFVTLLALSRAGSEVQAYYGTHSRIWEVLLGCLLAVAGGFPRMLRLPTWCSAALILIAISSLGVHSASWWMPPVRTVIVIVGTLQLIDALGRSPESAIARALGSRPVRFVGIVSYEVYLLHYAVIVAVQHLDWTSSLLVPLELGITIVAAYALHRLVAPLRAPSR